MAITIGQVCTDIATALAGIVTASEDTIIVHNYNQIKEGMNDYPLLQVYPDALEVDSRNETDAVTLSKAVRNHSLTVNLDVYAHTRNQIDENMQDVVECWDAVEDRLEDVTSGAGCPIFDQPLIRNIHWTVERATFPYATQEYAGVRFVLVMEIF
jgi:hypothetical protein